MAASEPLCHLIGINPSKLTREENYILEIEFFAQICEELKNIIKSTNKNYFRILKMDKEMENAMLDAALIRHVINDILLTQEYSLEGIAYYVQAPEEVICDVVSGLNSSPSLYLSRKIIDLHKLVRPNLYREIIKKITLQYLDPEINKEAL